MCLCDMEMYLNYRVIAIEIESSHHIPQLLVQQIYPQLLVQQIYPQLLVQQMYLQNMKRNLLQSIKLMANTSDGVSSYG